MKSSITTFLFVFCATLCMAQLPQKYDSLYKTIFAKDLCQMLEQNHELVLIDVRSPGEYSDTSSKASLNMGHLKGAVNIEIDSIKSNPEIMDKYRDKTVVLYCSHSQRSRGVSKLLAEKGFTSFFNLNGGMSSLNQLNEKNFPCKKDWLQSNLGYTNLSNADAIKLLKATKKPVVIDVRSVAQFNSKDTLPENNVGRIKGAINVPYDQLKTKMEQLKKYSANTVLVYSSTGDGDAARAASELVKNGFIHVYHLLSGLQSLLMSDSNLTVIQNPVPFKLINPVQAISLLKNHKGVLIYDVRPKTEFENRDDKYWKNLGHMKNAINLREEKFSTLNVLADKSAPILVYGGEASYKLGQVLATKGFTNVYVLPNFYDFVWSGFNVESCKEARDYVVDHEGLF